MLAFCLLYDEIRGERKYGLRTVDFDESITQRLNGFAQYGSHAYMPSNYVLLERVFRELNRYGHNKTLLDMGCGKGRVMLVAARFGFRQITGVELVREYCRQAEEQIKTASRSLPSVSFEILCTDAGTYRIPHGVQTVFFYNPFNKEVMGAVIENILASLRREPRPLFVVYLNPIFKQKFFATGFNEIYCTKRFGYLKASILRWENTA